MLNYRKCLDYVEMLTSSTYFNMIILYFFFITVKCLNFIFRRRQDINRYMNASDPMQGTHLYWRFHVMSQMVMTGREVFLFLICIVRVWKVGGRLSYTHSWTCWRWKHFFYVFSVYRRILECWPYTRGESCFFKLVKKSIPWLLDALPIAVFSFPVHCGVCDVAVLG